MKLRMKRLVAVLIVSVGAGAGIGIGNSAAAQTNEPTAVATETLFVNYEAEGGTLQPDFLDELEPETVLTIHATGFHGNTTGTVVQCVDDDPRRCGNRLRVRFDDRGTAVFQYLVNDQIGLGAGGGRCRLSAARCTIEVAVRDRIATVETFFVDEAPPAGRLDVRPSRGLLVGDTVTVTASDFAPGLELIVMVCAEPVTRGRRCGAPGPEETLTIGRDGTAAVDVALDAVVGADGVACGRRVGCVVVVASDQPGVRAAPVALSFAQPPGVEYVTPRVIIGLTAAAALVLLATWLVRSTDWNPPSESDSTPIDDAEYADLDLEASIFEEEPSPLAARRG